MIDDISGALSIMPCAAPNIRQEPLITTAIAPTRSSLIKKMLNLVLNFVADELRSFFFRLMPFPPNHNC